MRRVEVVADVGEGAGGELQEGGEGDRGGGVEGGAGQRREADGAGALAGARRAQDQRERRRSQHAGVAQDVEDPQHAVPRGAGGHGVGVRHHGDQHDRQRDRQPGEPFGHAGPVVGIAQHDQVGHGDDRQHDDGDQLLGDAARQVAEAVEDALPVLEVEEHRDPADGQKDGARDPGRHLRPLARPERGHQRLRPEQPRAPRHQRGEHDQRPLELHYSSPFQSRLRKMYTNEGLLPTLGSW